MQKNTRVYSDLAEVIKHELYEAITLGSLDLTWQSFSRELVLIKETNAIEYNRLTIIKQMMVAGFLSTGQVHNDVPRVY